MSETNFLLDIKLISNCKKIRKGLKCWNFDMVVDSEKSNYMDFIQSVVDKYPPGYLEVPHVQYYDDVLRTFPEVNCDQDFLNMFDMHNKKKSVQVFISYCDPSELFEPITEWDFEGKAARQQHRTRRRQLS